ncbi:hypothetical protein B0H13DRAFT_2350982 [Mycena leptocephala]|nr:hypothetical protein B0H13DRAFT_2350982 [Mycena leptocephala]
MSIPSHIYGISPPARLHVSRGFPCPNHLPISSSNSPRLPRVHLRAGHPLPDPTRSPLLHSQVKAFVQHFALPHSPLRAPLGRNDRIMIVLPTGPENALALLALASYHTCAPVNASCTAAELLDDARRLNAKAIVTMRDAEARLELRALRDGSL